MDRKEAGAPMFLQRTHREEHVSSEEDVSPLWLLCNRVSSFIHRVDVHATIVEDDYYQCNWLSLSCKKRGSMYPNCQRATLTMNAKRCTIKASMERSQTTSLSTTAAASFFSACLYLINGQVWDWGKRRPMFTFSSPAWLFRAVRK